MSKLSYVFIGIIAAALIFMGAVRGYQLYERKTAEWEEQRRREEGAFSFQNVPLSLASPQAEPVSYPVLFDPSSTKDVFLEDVPLAAEQEIQQARDTISSILEDYKTDVNLQSFNQDLAAATDGKAMDLRALSGGDLKQVLADNPEISAVVSKHLQNPDFAKTVQQILTNPQFVKSVQDLQQHEAGGTAAAKKTE
ncbi:MAG: hypothetical protein ACI4Q7_03300 [Candidatus Avelusimicrobium sp.]